MHTFLRLLFSTVFVDFLYFSAYESKIYFYFLTFVWRSTWRQSFLRYSLFSNLLLENTQFDLYPWSVIGRISFSLFCILCILFYYRNFVSFRNRINIIFFPLTYQFIKLLNPCQWCWLVNTITLIVMYFSKMVYYFFYSVLVSPVS